MILFLFALVPFVYSVEMSVCSNVDVKCVKNLCLNRCYNGVASVNATLEECVPFSGRMLFLQQLKNFSSITVFRYDESFIVLFFPTSNCMAAEDNVIPQLECDGFCDSNGDWYIELKDEKFYGIAFDIRSAYSCSACESSITIIIVVSVGVGVILVVGLSVVLFFVWKKKRGGYSAIQ